MEPHGRLPTLGFSPVHLSGRPRAECLSGNFLCGRRSLHLEVVKMGWAPLSTYKASGKGVEQKQAPCTLGSVQEEKV